VGKGEKTQRFKNSRIKKLKFRPLETRAVNLPEGEDFSRKPEKMCRPFRAKVSSAYPRFRAGLNCAAAPPLGGALKGARL
jgi:hypothetical protein